jgi:hypothetical protein
LRSDAADKRYSFELFKSMTKFSQRHGYLPITAVFQREAVDAELRIKLWNVLKISIWDDYDPSNYHLAEKSQKIEQLVKRLWFNFLNKDMDTLPEFHTSYGDRGAYGILKNFFQNCAWFQIYDFLEEIANDHSELLTSKVKEWLNLELERHNAAYRFVENQIAEITNQTEIGAIEEGLADADAPSRIHLEAGLRMLSNRESPDFRNSVKESISAVEASCRQVTGLSSATLADALRKVSNIHPAFLKAFLALYGYTSDASGIRHALTDEPAVSYADAKFMLVACAAFVSYIKVSAKNA